MRRRGYNDARAAALRPPDARHGRVRRDRRAGGEPARARCVRSRGARHGDVARRRDDARSHHPCASLLDRRHQLSDGRHRGRRWWRSPRAAGSAARTRCSSTSTPSAPRSSRSRPPRRCSGCSTDRSIAVSMGVLTSIGGGLLRDVLAGRPTLLMSREIYATPDPLRLRALRRYAQRRDAPTGPRSTSRWRSSSAFAPRRSGGTSRCPAG